MANTNGICNKTMKTGEKEKTIFLSPILCIELKFNSFHSGRKAICPGGLFSRISSTGIAGQTGQLSNSQFLKTTSPAAEIYSVLKIIIFGTSEKTQVHKKKPLYPCRTWVIGWILCLADRTILAGICETKNAGEEFTKRPSWKVIDADQRYACGQPVQL